MRKSSGGFTALLGGALLCAALLLPGCGGSGSADGGGGVEIPAAGNGMLNAVRSDGEFEKAVKEALAPVVAGNLPDDPAVFDAAATDGRRRHG